MNHSRKFFKRKLADLNRSRAGGLLPRTAVLSLEILAHDLDEQAPTMDRDALDVLELKYEEFLAALILAGSTL